jgi:hypothetical protein
MTATRKKVSRSSHIRRVHSGAPPTISPIGVFGARCGLHSLVVSPVGTILNQHMRPHIKDTKPARMRKTKARTGRRLERVGKAQAHARMYIKIDQRTCSPHGMIGGLLGLGAVLSCPPSSLTSISDIST